MSFWDGNYLFGEYNDELDASESKIVNPVTADNSSHAGGLPDLNEEFIFDGQHYYPVQNNPEYIVYGGQPSPIWSGHNNPEYMYGGQPSNYDYYKEPSVEEERNEHVEPKVERHERTHPTVSYETSQDFISREELVAWAVTRGLENGYVIVTQRSKKKGTGESAKVVKIWLQCDRGGEYKSIATVRRAGSKKTGCPFQLLGLYNSTRGVWKLQVTNGEHNHDPAQHLEGHSFARRLTPNQQRLVSQLAGQNMEPRNILSTLREQDPESVCIKVDVYNAIQKIRSEKKFGKTVMQVLEDMLHCNKYVYYTRVHPTTNVVEEVFFVHPISYELWRAFPHVLLIDATYKTNMYNLPFVQVVGVTSTGLSITLAHAFLSKEREDNYLWVLQMIKHTLDKCMGPRVIITDRDQALINACDKIFPDAAKYLCRFHILQNITRFCKQSFKSVGEWNSFIKAWKVLCKSPTPEIYEYNYNRLYHQLVEGNKRRVLKYVTDNWLEQDKEKFVSAWTNRTLNFGESTTNRVEGQHANLKRYLRSPNSSLDRIVNFVDEIVKSQLIESKASFQKSLMVTMTHHKLSLFDNLRGKVSHKALDLLEAEKAKLSVLLSNKLSCDCRLFTSCGLPCACRIAKYENTGAKIPIDAVDIFWRKLDLLSSVIEEEEIDVDRELDAVKQQILSQPNVVKKSLLSKIFSVVYPSKSVKKAPAVQHDIRGRPSLKKQEQRKRESKFEKAKNITQSQESVHDFGRHSSYISSSMLKPENPILQRSRSTTSKARTEKSTAKSTNDGFPLMTGDEHFNNITRFKDWIPSMFHEYISRIQDVKPDGNCGFRSVAAGLVIDENKWSWVRQELLEEMDTHERGWRAIFDRELDGVFNNLRHTINWSGIAPAPDEHWMWMPYTGLLIAQRFGVVVHFLSSGGSQTFFPMWSSPNWIRNHQFITFAHVNTNHFIMVKLEGEYPFPITNTLWNHHRDEQAAEWEILYRHRIADYMNKREKYCDGTIQYLDDF